MEILLNDQWRFAKLPLGSTLEDAGKAAFQPVDLPHDWLIWQTDDLYESADAWYVRKLLIPEDTGPVRRFLSFDGVYMDCDVLLNGEVIAHHPYGYTAFFVDLSGRTLPGENELMVHIRHRSPNSRWYSGSGIYRDVKLLMLPEHYLVPDGMTVLTETVGEDWTVTVKAETGGENGKTYQIAICDKGGAAVATSEGRSADSKIQAQLTVPKARTWAPGHPDLYTLNILYAGETYQKRIGLRSVLFDPDRGLIFNGEVLKLHGVCLHHDLGSLGSAFHEKAARRQLNLMRKMGVNAVRTSHNPPAARFLDLCDEMGILVIDEAFDMWERNKTAYDYACFFKEWAAKDVASWIRRDRCHPCVIMWSIGNEIYDVHADERGTVITEFLAKEVRLHDPSGHAAVTFGSNYMPWEGGQRCADLLDTVGYNYGEKYYDEHHRKHPSWVIYGSETGSILSSRGVYHLPMNQSIMSESDQQCSALGNSNTSWGATDIRTLLIDDLKNPYSMGQFIWSGIDYIGEPTPYHTRSCYFGQADTACFAKDPYYLYQSLWTDETMIHIGITWDWNPGQRIDVPVMTNCSEVELFLNGKSLGKKPRSAEDQELCLPVWTIPYEAGELKAVGYDRTGTAVAEAIRYTPGDSASFRLTAEEDGLNADGWDLAFVSVTAEDAKGHPVENARDYVRISVTGGGCLMGTDNGDSTDRDGYKSSCRRLFNGKLLLIIGSTGEEENVTVRVTGSQGKEAVLTIPVLPSERAAGTTRQQRIPDEPLRTCEPVRKIEITAEGITDLTADNAECIFHYTLYPANASQREIRWQVTNETGIETPFVSLQNEGDRIRVHAYGDGNYRLRALWGEREGETELISQIELTAAGIGNPSLDAYHYISAGLYDLSEGTIGAGNDKGIAFSRDGESMVGFSRVDFGKDGSNRITADIFALNGDAYDLDLFDGNPSKGGSLIQVLRYQKESIWNVYQPETWELRKRLTGVRTICFRMKDKVHLKGFVFEKQEKAWSRLTAGSADAVYGDSFVREEESITGIGNNVTLIWKEMDFGEGADTLLSIEGKTPLKTNTIMVQFQSADGKESKVAAEFRGGGQSRQDFRMRVPAGMCTVSLIFLPGSQFDLHAFTFRKAN